MIGRYRRGYCESHGLVVLEETTTELLVGYWKREAPGLRDTLSAFHGKSPRFTPVHPRHPIVRIALDSLEQKDLDPDMEGGSAPPNHPDPGKNLLRLILDYAVRIDASDLSLWRISTYQWQIALRVHGVVHPVGLLPDRSAQLMIRRLKAMAGLDLFETERAQDGRIEFPWLPGHSVRVATMGDRYQEALALRFLDRTPIPLLALGFTQRQVLAILAAIDASQGLIVLCGPTGSGKTTSAAAILSLVAFSGRKIVSLEDPIEYRIEGVLQLEEHHHVAQEERLAALLRQDPDVIWLGEVRRPGSARILQEAVLTGHLVLVTVHCADLGTLDRRLAGLGFDAGLLPEILVLASAQRLVGSPPHLAAQLSTEASE